MHSMFCANSPRRAFDWQTAYSKQEIGAENAVFLKLESLLNRVIGLFINRYCFHTYISLSKTISGVFNGLSVTTRRLVDMALIAITFTRASRDSRCIFITE